MKKLSFLEMMGVLPSGIHPSHEGLVFDLYDEALLSYLSEDYEKNLPLLQKPGKAKIPKIIHFIWLGPKPFPEESVANVLSWKKYNSDWKLYFWTDSQDRSLPIAEMEQKLVQDYDFKSLAPLIEQSSNYGEKSDLMRYVFLHDIGGFYVDHDSECLHSLEPLLQFDSCLSCEEPQERPAVNGSAVLFQNGSLGFTPRHPFLSSAMQHVVSLWQSLDERYPDNGKPTPSWKTLRRTFNCLTIAVKELLASPDHRKKYHDLILPTCYFFPNRILSPEDMKRFQKSGVIWASHSYAGLWAEGVWEGFYYD